ncbi:hypothetical protein GIB67_011511 [Kingdonia uniflora]|uniref:SUI1 domain-containing protein n=1 Tax=Kingdonia uniflora TaxID=39325 RepID=A0A7J7NLX0_9MAGN|nr:hypothetical protein GIB67_011511 [Kingdonia uniflora]
MVELEFQYPIAFDPCADAEEHLGTAGVEEYVHVRIQQRKGLKPNLVIKGKEVTYDKLLKLLKEFCCNGNVVQDKELGKVIQLQGDQRKNASQMFIDKGIVKKKNLKIHGF